MKEKEFVEIFKLFLINKKHFPPSLLSTERQLKNVRGRHDLCTRFDLIAFYLLNGNYFPLVIFELKRSDKFIKSAIGQVISYNNIVHAHFMCVSTPYITLTSSKYEIESECIYNIYGTKWFLGIPDFNQLISILNKGIKIT